MIGPVREWLYREKLLRSVSLPATVVSVGNISMGGTGKSPFVILLAEWAVARGLRTAVLSRGYGRRGKELVVLRPHDPLPSAERIGDEPWMIKHRVPGVALLVHPDRGRMAERHWEELGRPQLVILDDGFQHWRIARDRDVVMVDAAESLDARALPLGRLRERAPALKRADFVLLTRAERLGERERAARLTRLSGLQAARQQPLWKRGQSAHPAVAAADYEVLGFLDARTGEPVARPERELLLVSGIAKPDRLRETARRLGLPVREEIYFPDHHRLRPQDRRQILRVLAGLRDGALLVTEKDRARWLDLFGSEVPGYVLQVGFRFLDGTGTALDGFLADLSREVEQCSTLG